MATGLSFAFDANKETPQDAQRRRAIAEAIMGRTMSPQNVGEGFGAIAQGIVANVQNQRAGAAEQAGRAGAASTRAQLASMLGGGAMPANANAGAMGAANAVGQSAPTTSSFSGSQQEFIDMLLPTALEVSQQTGIDPRIIIAQAAQETGWGRSAPGNNFFGIKSHGQPGGQTFNTHEYVNGQRVNVADSFRTFGSPEDSVRGYGEFIQQNPRYSDFMAAQGLDAQLEALGASGYATDPNYASSVGSIARGIALPQQPTHGALPPSAAPGTVMQGPDGQYYQYAETTGMAGASGGHGWIRFNPSAGQGEGVSQQPTQVASLDPGILRDIPATAGNIDPGILRTLPDGVQNIDPGILRPMPDTPAQNPASGLFDPGLAMGNAQPQQVAQAGNLPMQPQQPQMASQQQAPGSDIPVEFLMEALASPWVDDATKAVASQLLQQQLAPPPGPVTVGDVLVDPNTGRPIYDARNPSVTNVNGTVIDNRTGQPIYQAPQQRPYEIINGEVVYLDPQAGTAESAGQFGAPEPGWRGLSPEEKAAYGIPADSPAQINTATGEVKGLGGVNVTTNVGGSPSNFFQSLGEAEVENYTTMLQQGPVAARTLNQIDQLESLLANTPQGFGAAATAFAGNFGIDLGDASGVQAATALINQMVPAQRPPGSGPMSDADLELFKQSVPRLINQPGGNELIIQTMRDMAQYDLALSRIIQEHTWLAESARSPEEQSEIRRQMRDQIDALQNPLENFNARIAPYRREGGTPEGGGQSQANPDILPAPDGVPADLWGVMTPEERALWQ